MNYSHVNRVIMITLGLNIVWSERDKSKWERSSTSDLPIVPVRCANDEGEENGGP